jgi:hypothetical protein
VTPYASRIIPMIPTGPFASETPLSRLAAMVSRLA